MKIIIMRIAKSEFLIFRRTLSKQVKCLSQFYFLFIYFGSVGGSKASFTAELQLSPKL
jgi:hypothetical protein